MGQSDILRQSVFYLADTVALLEVCTLLSPTLVCLFVVSPLGTMCMGGANAVKRLDSLLFPVVDSVSFGRHLIRRLNSPQLPDSEPSDSLCPF